MVSAILTQQEETCIVIVLLTNDLHIDLPKPGSHLVHISHIPTVSALPLAPEATRVAETGIINSYSERRSELPVRPGATSQMLRRHDL